MKLNQLHADKLVEGNFAKSLPLLAAGVLGNYSSQANAQDTQNVGVESQRVSDSDLYKYIANWEGKRSKVYEDTRGIPTIGVGFNLQRSDARQLLKNAGADYDKVLSGDQELTDKQIQYLFEYTVNGAKQIARKLVPELDDMYPSTQMIIIDLAFQLGHARLSEFKKFLKAINEWDYKTAADELIDSKWFKQSGRRSKHHVDTLLSFIAK